MDKNKDSIVVRVKLLYIIAFFEGASVMGVELIGAKMIAPYFGTSLYVWASVLGLTLVGLASGYFLGGELSKKMSNIRLLNIVLAVAVISILFMPSWGKFVMMSNLDNSIAGGTIISGILFLLPPLLLLGSVSPIIINLITSQYPFPGKVSGRVYGISTVGGIFMTFFMAFYLMPTFGVVNSTYVTGIVLSLFPIVHFILNKKKIPIAVFTFCMIVVFAKAKDLEQNDNNYVVELYNNEGVLGKVVVTDDSKSGKRTLYVNNIPQTLMHVPTGRSLWRYVHRIAFYASLKPKDSKVLVCGLGGGALASEFNYLGFNVEFVEIDPRIRQTAIEYFNLDRNANINVDDARHFINTCKKSYDVIVFDVSTGENQPSNIYTIECFKKAKNLLKSNGIMFVHYQNTISGPESIATKSIGKTIEKAGLKCKLLNTRENLNEINEVMFFCSKNEFKLENASFDRHDKFSDPYKFPIGRDVYIENYSFVDGLILTDDVPKMELLHQNTIQHTRDIVLQNLKN